MSEQEPVSDEVAEEAADLILEAEQQLQENRAKQEEFLDAVADEYEVEVIETECNIVGDHTVSLKATLDGELMDEIGGFLERLEEISDEGAKPGETSEIARRVSEMLADLIEEDAWTADTFYTAYERTTLDALGDMLLTAFDSLSKERERRRGTADGFREESGGT